MNIKLYGKREGLLDIPPRVPAHFLVLAAPVRGHVLVGWDSPADHRGGLLFDGPGLVSRLQERGVRIGVATSVTSAEWERARVWPLTAGRGFSMTEDQQAALSLFSAEAK